jgi:hypothetical protein
MSIYVLAASPGCYKIGYTIQTMARRLTSLQTGALQPLNVIEVIPVPKEHANECERAVHAALARFWDRTAGGTEFFRMDKGEEELCALVRRTVHDHLAFRTYLNATLKGFRKPSDTREAQKRKKENYERTSDTTEDAADATETEAAGGNGATDVSAKVSPPTKQQIDATVAQLFARRAELEAQLRPLEVERRILESELLRCFAQKDVSYQGRTLLRWRQSSQRRVDLDMLRANFADTAATCTRAYTTSTPMFL